MKHIRSTMRIEAIRTTAKASDYYPHIDSLKPVSVALYARVSRPQYRHHLVHQEANLRRESERRGDDVIGVFQEVASGSAENRFALERAALVVKEVGGVVVAESRCRFARGFRKKEQRRNVLPSVLEMERLMALVDEPS